MSLRTFFRVKVLGKLSLTQRLACGSDPRASAGPSDNPSYCPGGLRKRARRERTRLEQAGCALAVDETRGFIWRFLYPTSFSFVFCELLLCIQQAGTKN